MGLVKLYGSNPTLNLAGEAGARNLLREALSADFLTELTEYFIMYTQQDIVRIDNFIPLHYQRSLNSFLLSPEFPLYKDAGTAYDPIERVTADMPVYPDAATREHPQLIHSFAARGEIASQFWPRVAPLFFELERQLGRECRILRCKLNLNTQDSSFSDSDHYPAHIDVAQKDCVTAIYYVADSDGDTRWYNDDMTELHRETPRQGTLVYFPCRIRHAGSPPRTTQYRWVINFNVKLV